MLVAKLIAGGRTIPCIKTPNHQSLFLQKIRIPQCFSSYNSDEYQKKRLLHISHNRRDMESAFRAIGAGIAITGVIGPGIGVGIIFGNLLTASARNPSMTDKFFQSAIMGAAFCEALGLLATLIAFLGFFM